ncbi:MAG TPA: hypothetical protein VK277_11260 [Acidimicrobiales bacterium]|nr:hypothetical protein [Acidimicrobiales bacterium]
MPRPQGRRGSAAWANARVITFSTLSDGILDTPPPCLSQLRREFLAQPHTPLATAACAATAPPIQFAANP